MPLGVLVVNHSIIKQASMHACKAQYKMPKANEMEAIIAVQRERVLAIHLTSHTIITIIKTTTNAIHSNPTNHLHSFTTVLHSAMTRLYRYMQWAKQHGKCSSTVGLGQVDRLTCSASFTQGRHHAASRADLERKPARLWGKIPKLIGPRNKLS